MERIAIATVVTGSLVSEFLLLRHSFALRHGTEIQWCVRADRSAAEALGVESDVRIRSWPERHEARLFARMPGFSVVAAQKMEAMSDAWEVDGVDAVLLLDADVVVVGDVGSAVRACGGDVVLSPNYYPSMHEFLAPTHGYFNSGMIFSRSRQFHVEWGRAFVAEPWRFTDQACLNEVARMFRVGLLGRENNVGFWRSPRYSELIFEPVPEGTTSVHCHLFQGLRNRREWIDRAFGIKIVEFLAQSGDPLNREVLEYILDRDVSGWYRSSLRLLDRPS